MTDKITSVIAKESNGNIQITFSIPFPLVKKAQDETLDEMAKDVEIAGFRKGKAPLEKVKEKIPQNKLLEHSLSHLLPKALADAINESKLKIAIYPKFELIKADENADWQIRAVTCELPEFDLGNYKDIVAGEIRSASLKKDLTKEEKESTVIKALVGNVKINIPQILVEEEADSRLSGLLSRIEKLGLALESYLASIHKTAEDLRAEYAQQAKEAIAIDLILTRIAVSESFKVSEKELTSALSVSSATTPTKGEEDEARRKRLLESILLRRMALEFLSNLS